MMTPEEKKELKSKLEEARCNFLSCLAYTMEVDERISKLTNVFSWRDYPGVNTEEEREALLKKLYYEADKAMSEEIYWSRITMAYDEALKREE